MCAMCMLGRNNVLQTVYIGGQVTGQASRSTLDLTAEGSGNVLRIMKYCAGMPVRAHTSWFCGNYG